MKSRFFKKTKQLDKLLEILVKRKEKIKLILAQRHNTDTEEILKNYQRIQYIMIPIYFMKWAIIEDNLNFKNQSVSRKP